MIDTTVKYIKMCDALTKWNAAYRKGAPVVPDEVYDQIRKEVKNYEATTPEYKLAVTPTEQVGAIMDIEERLSGGPILQHATRMLSLENALNTEEASKWLKKWRKLFGDDCEVIGEFKYNGLAVRVTYIDGILTRAATRGDGEFGQDITSKARVIFPATVDATGTVEMTCEVVIPIRVYNQHYSDYYDNPLSAVVGIISKTSSHDLIYLDFQPYSITSTDIDITSQEQSLNLIKDLFKSCEIFPNIQYFKLGLDDVEKTFRHVEHIRKSIPVDIDGMVFKLNKYEHRAKTTDTNHHPNHSFAYKFTPTIVTTTLNKVIFQVGRTGVITGVAKFSPVTLLGNTVTSAVIENQAKLEELQIAIGDMYGVYKSGDVIPKISKRIMGESALVTFPTNCPCCGTELVKRGAEHFCPNDKCNDRLVANLVYMSSKEVLGIQGLGPSTVKSMITHLGVRTIADVYRLTEKDIATLPGYSEHSAHNLKFCIDKCRVVPLEKFIAALAIPGIGKVTATKLANITGSLSEFMELTSLDAINAKGLTIEPAVATTVIDYLRDPLNAQVVRDLKYVLDVPIKEIPEKLIIQANGVTGYSFVFTGYIGIPRKIAADAVQSRGGYVSDSVTSTTKYLVVGEGKTPENSSKYKRATLHGTDVLSPVQFMELLQLNKENNQ